MRRLMTWIWAIGIMGIVPVYAQQTPAATNALPAAKSWADNLKMSGDLRYRYESINDDSKLDAKKKTSAGLILDNTQEVSVGTRVYMSKFDRWEIDGVSQPSDVDSCRQSPQCHLITKEEYAAGMESPRLTA